MKSSFSTSWKSSKQVRKQRKYFLNSPYHIKHKFLSANLSKELRKKYNKRSLPLRKGDEVLVMRGAFKKKKAKVISVNKKNSLVALENIQRTKKDGTKVNVHFHPSVLQIQSIFLEDKERISVLERSKKNASN
ncbi:MAG: 50S ribosomal protein L24 [Nanoarchaeota archaeon]